MKLNLRPKHHNHTQNRAYPLATRNLPLSPYLGALELQFAPSPFYLELKFAPSPFYKFVALDLMVLYQLKSLILDDYNLTYSQNKNRVFEKKKLIATPLKLHYFLYTKISQNQSKPIKTTKNNLEKPPKLVYNQYKHFHSKNLGFSSTQHKKIKVKVWFPYL